MQASDPYQTVDRVLMPWAKRHGIHVYTTHRDDPVRSMFVVDLSGAQRHLYLDPPNESGLVTLRGIAPSMKEERQVTLADLERALEQLWPLVFG